MRHLVQVIGHDRIVDGIRYRLYMRDGMGVEAVIHMSGDDTGVDVRRLFLTEWGIDIDTW